MTNRAIYACDSSVAIASLDPNHEGHQASRRRVVETRPALAGHAVYETYAVLTRLPPPLRLTGRQAAGAIAAAFPEECSVEEPNPSRLSSLAELSIVGGATYDALVGQAAIACGRKLLTRDRRAERTYRALGVDYEFVS